MPHVDLDGVTLWYDTVPSPRAAAPPALLIQGLGMQATDWPAALLSLLARERPLILFDNRDAGLSQLFGLQHNPTLQQSHFPGWHPLSSPPSYTLGDMADDVIRLLDALDLPAAHIIGFSMGGMIAQILAARHADRIISMVGLMTSAGQAWLESSPEADRMMRQSIVDEPDQQRLIEAQLQAEEVYAGPSELPDRTERQKALYRTIMRGHHSAGIWRQAVAMRAADDRRSLIRTITTPMLMVHGQQDPVIALSQAASITGLLPAARFIELSRTGHVLTEDNGHHIAGIISAFWETLSAT